MGRKRKKRNNTNTIGIIVIIIAIAVYAKMTILKDFNFLEEIQNLKNQKVDFQKNNNSAAVSRLDAEITRKTDTLTEYTNAKNVELESLKKNLQNSDSFYKKLYGVLERVAENEGYSMILSLQQANAVLWYSPSVDITEKVIAELGI